MASKKKLLEPPKAPVYGVETKMKKYIPKADMNFSELPELPEMPEELPEPPAHHSKFKLEFPSLFKKHEDHELEQESEFREGKIERKKLVDHDKPIFIKIENFKEIVSSLDLIEKKVKSIEQALIRLKKIKSKEDSELEEWEKQLREVKTKINNIDRKLSSKV